jgi:hypothetical protein
LNLRYFPAPFGALGGGPKYKGGRGASWMMIDCTTTVESTIVIFRVCLPGVATFWVNCMTGVVFRVQFRDFGHDALPWSRVNPSTTGRVLNHRFQGRHSPEQRKSNIR